MGRKIWFLLTVVTIVQSKDLSEGSDDFGTTTKKIFDENKKANPAIWRQVDNITINGDEGAKINKILVTDLREEKDGEAKIVEGGIGQRNVTIELKSPTALRGYDFHIEVYANTDSQAATSHDASKQESNPEKPSEEKKPINAVPIVPISLIRDELPSTSEQPQDSLNENKRQSRDAEEKDKLNKQLNPHSFTDVTTEVPELKSTAIPATNKDKREDKVLEQGITNHQIHLQEAPKMPESTARSIPTAEFKIAEEKHNHQETRNVEENKKQTNFDTNDKQTNINYSQFNVREVSSNVPVNTQSPVVEGQKRHARDVNQNTPIESTEHPLPPAASRDQGSTTTKVPSEARHIENSPAVLTEDKQNKDHVQVDKVEEKTIHEHHNHNHRFSGRYIPDRFAHNPISASKRETSTEINKVSTIASTNVNSAQSFNSTPVIPKIIANDQTTTKPEITTDKQVDSDINSELHINTNKKSASEEITANKRITRDTTDKIKEQPLLPTVNMKDSPSSTTLKPELNGFKAPVVASDNKKEIKHETPKADNSENKDKQRNIRGTEDNKEKINNLSTSTTKPDNKESNEKVSTDKTPVPVPILLKSTPEVKTQLKDVPNEKERIARDVDINKSNNDEKLSATTDATGIETEKAKKSDEKVTVEYQSLISTIKDNKEEKAPTTPASNENATKSEINPKIEENDTQNGDLKNLPGKFTREIKNIKETSTIEEQNNKNDLSTTNTPLIDRKEKTEPKKPEKSLVPPQ